MTRRLGYLVLAAGAWILNTAERWHGKRTRDWNAGHGAVTTRRSR